MSSALLRPTVVLDLDGTLVDSVYQHVASWQAAFHDVGLHVGAVRIHESIGMGGDRLVAEVAGESAESAVGDEVRRLHDTYFRAGLRTICPLDGASELVDALVERGHRVVLASSSEAGLVDELLDIAGVGHRLHAVVTGSDEAASKPAPDLVELAVQRAGGGPAVVVGDATWDVESAAAAGVASIGLRSGGVSAERLLAAGAVAVHEGPRDLLDHLDESLLAAR
ncbi:HAD family hydrolase [Nocardioides baculatus]|uniref:HAD family hydrolase n=1 Tax=Nocardioides baculatus TaxID=2801337 RepID=A0ABS1L3T7_9ACTN|nr:HAD family hydrolase [Nocardioides baculatus]MBL0746213.1 HAD family hydrolase [Nocardioides baculatus]